MRWGAFAAILALTAGPAVGQTILTTPGTGNEPPHDASKLILPNPLPTRPGLAPDTLPPLWLVPLPDAATREAERAELDAALAARFGHDRALPPPQKFDTDIVPLAGGLPWQAMQRRLDGTLGP
jgi:hypothetical protein